LSLYVGCSGWSYGGWKGTFYPPNLENKEWLSYYSRFFRFVEVDSTFYSIPSRFVVKGWNDKTPDDFRFALKFPKAITHDNKLQDSSKHLYPFFHALEPLLDKILVLLIQLPPYMSEKKGFEPLQSMVKRLDSRYRYALEVRESTWFNKKVYDFLNSNKISLAWSVRDELKTPSIVTSDQIYIRFIGDRSINENDFGRIVKNRDKDVIEYVDRLNEMQKEKAGTGHSQTIIAFNNHFAGFGPESANTFLRLVNEPEANWKKDLDERQKHQVSSDLNAPHHSQTSISDYSSPK
jgi:uncharacterized protein YecE (DUF72 family)